MLNCTKSSSFLKCLFHALGELYFLWSPKLIVLALKFEDELALFIHLIFKGKNLLFTKKVFVSYDISHPVLLDELWD